MFLPARDTPSWKSYPQTMASPQLPTSSEEDSTSKPIQIGSSKNFWLYDPQTSSFDLSHPPPLFPPLPQDKPLTLKTTTNPIKISPSKTALVIIDMQNFFLSPLIHKTRGPGHIALDNLAETAIPACRSAGIQIIYLNWGLTERDIEEMPPAGIRAFGFGGGRDRFGKFAAGARVGLGNEMGVVRDEETGEEVEMGRMLMRDQWNTKLCPPLDSLYESGKKLEAKPDVWIHKNRMSGMWGSKAACEEFLEEEGIKTLMFAGVNTDQCVGGTVQDAWSKGYDCIFVKDATGTTSPEFSQNCWEFNAERSLGFVVSCQDIVDGVESMK